MRHVLIQCALVTALIIGGVAVGYTHDLNSAPSPAPATSRESPAVTLFQNVRIFWGKGSELSGPSHVLVRGNQIEKISSQPISLDRRGDSVIIDAAGRTLMPGLIDAHTHMMFANVPQLVLMTSDVTYSAVVATKGANEMLLRGFTSSRDMGGPIFGLKRAIDQGLVPGPRIWPSGATISQTAGHGDFRMPNDFPSRPGDHSFAERVNATAIADGVPAVLQRSREQLAMGASQIKVMAGGGVASLDDPLDVNQYTSAEMRAAVDAAANWGTYVTVHAYTPGAVRQAVQAGVKCIEHGQLLDEATIKFLGENGIWLSLQPFTGDKDTFTYADPMSTAKYAQMVAGTDQAYRWSKQHKVKVAFGTDALFDANLAARQGAQLTKLTRWYSPAEVLTMATSTNAELLALSGPRNPYPGKLGVVEEGALADLLLVDGNPLENIKLIEDPEKNFLVIMKDGRIYKNLLRCSMECQTSH
ncbi:MAG: hydrolase [Nitrospira sp. SG-bin1]|nr:MAG: hydrolase [Nitrospira sp. SG-bin1]